MAKLTERQRRFVEHYVSTGNALESARLAGYKSTHAQAQRLIQNDTIKGELAKQAEAHSEQLGITRQGKKKRLQEIAEGDDDRLSMQAIDIDNKMEAEYVQKVQVEDVTAKEKIDIFEGAIKGLLLDADGRRMLKEAMEGMDE